MRKRGFDSGKEPFEFHVIPAMLLFLVFCFPSWFRRIRPTFCGGSFSVQHRLCHRDSVMLLHALTAWTNLVISMLPRITARRVTFRWILHYRSTSKNMFSSTMRSMTAHTKLVPFCFRLCEGTFSVPLKRWPVDLCGGTFFSSAEFGDFDDFCGGNLSAPGRPSLNVLVSTDLFHPSFDSVKEPFSSTDHWASMDFVEEPS